MSVFSLPAIAQKLLENSTKLGAVWAAINAYQLTQRGGVINPQEMLLYLGGPLMAGASAEWLPALLAKIKELWMDGTLPNPKPERRAFVQSVMAMLEELQAEGTPEALTIEAKWPDKPPVSASWRKGILKSAPVLLLCLSLLGCVPPLPRPVDPDKPDPKPTPTLSRAEICDELADLIPSRIKTTDDLLQVFRLLADGGDWTKDDSAAVDSVLPGMAGTKRALTADDASKLREVK